jgi:hypothetical protein
LRHLRRRLHPWRGRSAAAVRPSFPPAVRRPVAVGARRDVSALVRRPPAYNPNLSEH